MVKTFTSEQWCQPPQQQWTTSGKLSQTHLQIVQRERADDHKEKERYEERPWNNIKQTMRLVKYNQNKNVGFWNKTKQKSSWYSTNETNIISPEIKWKQNRQNSCWNKTKSVLVQFSPEIKQNKHDVSMMVMRIPTLSQEIRKNICITSYLDDLGIVCVVLYTNLLYMNIQCWKGGITLLAFNKTCQA